MIIHDVESLLTSQQPTQIEIRPAFKQLLELLSGHNAEDLEMKVVKVKSRLS